MFTVVFAVARSVGWISQWCEMAGEVPARISRPRQMYEGEGERQFVPVGDRGGGVGDMGDTGNIGDAGDTLPTGIQPSKRLLDVKVVMPRS